MLHNASYPMSLDTWKSIQFFSPKEFGCVDMDGTLIYTLQELRKYVNKPIVIHCGYEERGSGYHPKKCAVDFHIVDMHVVDQFLVASRYDMFNGMGVYPLWNSPGLHVDTRPKNYKLQNDVRWGCLSPGKYVKLDRSFFAKII